MDVTVIIVSWNSQDQIRMCLQHLSDQTIQPLRIMVLDNDSSDSSAKIAEEFGNVDVLRMDSNLGFAAGNNRALEGCDTKWIALLNPDAFPEPDWLENMSVATVENPGFVAFASRQLRDNNFEVLDGIGDSYHISGKVWRRRCGTKQQPDDLVSREIFSPCAAAALYQRRAMDEVGGFDEDYFCYLEDVDLGFRLRLAGHKIMYVPSAVVHHVGSASTGGQHSDFSVYHGHRNLVWTYIKDMPGVLFWLLLPLHLLLNIVTIFWFVVRGKGKVIFRSKWDAIKRVPRMWRKRKHIQRNRKVTVGEIWRVLEKSLIRNR